MKISGFAVTAVLRCTARSAAGVMAACMALTANAAETVPPTSSGSLLQVLVGLVVVLGLMAAAAWTLKRFGAAKSAGGTTVRIVGGVSVGNRERVLVVEVADQWIVVGVAPGRVNALATMARGEAMPAGTADAETNPAKNFSAWLKQTIEKRNGNA
jgi:flagellar protein FliO/FliZ